MTTEDQTALLTAIRSCEDYVARFLDHLDPYTLRSLIMELDIALWYTCAREAAATGQSESAVRARVYADIADGLADTLGVEAESKPQGE